MAESGRRKGGIGVADDSNGLGELGLAELHHSPIEIGEADGDLLVGMLKSMKRIRRCEEVIGELVQSGEVQCPCHLTIGQEACAVGVTWALDSDGDQVFGAHRSHGHYLALGGSVRELLAEVLGKEEGCARGMGGSMHLIDPERGLLGTVPIVGATVPMACGAALSAKMDGNGALVVSFFGDGAAEEGVVHESMNLASTHALPVLFACENNLFSSHMQIRLRQPSDRVARFAEAHCIPATTVDGNDVLAVNQATHEAIGRARRGEGPSFLEMVTYRWRGHVGPREDLDVGVAREGDLPMWKRRDPIGRLEAALLNRGKMSQEDIEEMGRDLEEEIQAALDFARNAAFPGPDATTRYLYMGRSAS